MKITDFIIFESLRAFNKGWGLLTAVHSSLSPIQINSDVDCEDILVVCIEIINKKVHLINGYGQQEDADFDQQLNFFVQLELAFDRS